MITQRRDMPEEQESSNQERPEDERLEEPGEAGEIRSLKTRLEEERKARAELEAAMTLREERISQLERALSQLKESMIPRYLEAVRAANPSIPAEIISGSSIEEIDASVERARAIASALRASLESRAREVRVPAGAPPREAASGEGLSPREKIALGIQQKGGSS